MKHGDCIAVLQVVFKVLPRQGDVRISKVVKNLADLVVAEKRRVELYKRVDLLLGKHVGADGLDFLGRTTMHGAQCCRRTDVGTDFGAQALELLFQALPGGAFEQAFIEHCFHFREILIEPLVLMSVDHTVDVLLHLRRLYAFQVVTDGHIEDERGLFELALMHSSFQHMQNDPCLCILIPSLGEGELGRPLNVVGFITGIDAGLVDLQGIHDLNGLQLHEPATDEIAGDDVLGKLGMGAGGGTERCGAALAEYPDTLFPRILIELLLCNTKNGMMISVLTDNTTDKFREGNGAHDISHIDSFL